MRTLVILAVVATALSLACGSDDSGGGGGGGSSAAGGSGGCAPTGEGGTHAVDTGVDVEWTLEKDGAPAACATFEKQSGVQVIVTAGADAVASQTFACKDAGGLVRGLEPGDYVVSVALVDAGGLALVTADPQTVSTDLECIDPRPYACSTSGTCVESVSVTLR